MKETVLNCLFMVLVAALIILVTYRASIVWEMTGR